ncbi:MAG: NAD-dependent epimerase/dehydratase family protein [Deltaproteobacteria bacterium]|nr:NAD-dependent epimerase/dehydratase family protein [Deltaproteobacteria bacterium]
MRSLVTGVAGFVGSSLAERLIREGHEVIGVDCFTDHYARSIKEENLKGLLKEEQFTFFEADVSWVNLGEFLNGVDYVFHQAAQAGVRSSWGDEFNVYTSNNVLATQRLLEACKGLEMKRFIYASSSSVYGDSEELPLREQSFLKPVSPYGVTKLAGEYLCYSYWKNFDIPVVSLRYFTVYGPRQRPDMAFHRFIKAILNDENIEIYGDGEQTRDFTFISDAIEGNMLAMKSDTAGEVFNIGGGSRVSVNEVLEGIQKISGKAARIVYRDVQKGDVRHTLADTSKARKHLGYVPKINLNTGLTEQWKWLKGN